jgi:DNA-directed RNA polymerase subunit beta'
VEASQEGKLEIRNRNLLQNAEGDMIVMGRNVQVAVKDEQGRERATYKLVYGSRLLVKDGDAIERGQRLAEWDPYTLPIIAETNGVVRLVDLTRGVSVREEVDEATGISQRIVSDWRAAPKGNELKPAISVMEKPEDGAVATEVAPVAHGADAVLQLAGQR